MYEIANSANPPLAQIAISSRFVADVQRMSHHRAYYSPIPRQKQPNRHPLIKDGRQTGHLGEETVGKADHDYCRNGCQSGPNRRQSRAICAPSAPNVRNGCHGGPNRRQSRAICAPSAPIRCGGRYSIRLGCGDLHRLMRKSIIRTILLGKSQRRSHHRPRLRVGQGAGRASVDRLSTMNHPVERKQLILSPRSVAA